MSHYIKMKSCINYIRDLLFYFSGHPSEAVGFSAYTLEERAYNDGDVVIFDGVVSNFGGFFDFDSSIFVCPYSGIYWFSVSCLSKIGYPCTPAINVETKEILKTHGATGSHGNQGSTSTVVECKAGERVWVRNVSDDEAYNGWDKTNSFSGFMLHRY